MTAPASTRAASALTAGLTTIPPPSEARLPAVIEGPTSLSQWLDTVTRATTTVLTGLGNPRAANTDAIFALQRAIDGASQALGRDKDSALREGLEAALKTARATSAVAQDSEALVARRAQSPGLASPGVEARATPDIAKNVQRARGTGTDLGVRYVGTPEVLGQLDAHIDDVARRAVDKLLTHMQSTVGAGVALFTDGYSPLYSRHNCTIVDKRRVKRDIDRLHSVPRATAVFIEHVDTILREVSRKFPRDVLVLDEAVFLVRVREAIAERLAERPELCVALVVEKGWSDRSGRGIGVLYTTDFHRPWWKRWLGIGKSSDTLRLAPPAPEVIPPVSLPFVTQRVETHRS